MRWEDLTWMEFERIDRSTPVVMNLAAIEQHGPHLPVSTDSSIGGFFMEELDRRLDEKILVLPQVKVCCSSHHMDFPGTLSVRHETLVSYVGDILESVVTHGFCNLILVNSHGGNRAIGQVILEKFGAAHQDCNIVFLTWWHLAARKLEAIQESGFTGLGHACEFETALMMHAAPNTVHTELISGQNYIPGFPWADADMLVSSPASHYRTIKDVSGGTGVLGDPSLASAEKGARITEAVMEDLIEVVTAIRAKTKRPVKAREKTSGY